MEKFFPLGLFIFLSTATVLLVGCKGNDDKQVKGPGPEKKSEPDKKEPEAPPDSGKPSGKAPRLSDLKFTLPKGWEAKHQEGSNSWKLTKDAPPDYPDIYIGWLVLRDQHPKDLDDFVQKLQKGPDHFAFGFHWASVIEKGKLPDGLYVVGKLKLKSDKEAKRTGFSIVRELNGEKVIFECFSVEDAKERKAAMDICKSAKF